MWWSHLTRHGVWPAPHAGPVACGVSLVPCATATTTARTSVQLPGPGCNGSSCVMYEDKGAHQALTMYKLSSNQSLRCPRCVRGHPIPDTIRAARTRPQPCPSSSERSSESNQHPHVCDVFPFPINSMQRQALLLKGLRHKFVCLGLPPAHVGPRMTIECSCQASRHVPAYRIQRA